MTGDWTCEAKSSVGEAVKTYNLDILLPPTIQIEKKNMIKEVVESGDIVLDCIVDGEPKPAITWKLNGRLLDPYFSDLSEDKMKLYLKNTKSYNSGKYTCEVENRVGVDEISYNVTVLTAPKVHAINPQQQSTAEANVTLTCLSDGVPKPRLIWEKNGIVLTPTTSKIALEEESITISQLTREDSGTYSCTAVSDIGEDRGFITLNVRHRPEVKSPQRNHVAIVHEAVTMQCAAEGSPQPMIRWERNGIPVSGQDCKLFQLSSAQISSAQLCSTKLSSAQVSLGQFSLARLSSAQILQKGS
jgi:hemicentin